MKRFFVNLVQYCLYKTGQYLALFLKHSSPVWFVGGGFFLSLWLKWELNNQQPFKVGQYALLVLILPCLCVGVREYFQFLAGECKEKAKKVVGQLR